MFLEMLNSAKDSPNLKDVSVISNGEDPILKELISQNAAAAK